MTKGFCCIVLVLLLTPYLWAQEQLALKGNALAIVYEEGWHTRGFGASFRKEQVKIPWAVGVRVYGVRDNREQLIRPSEIYTQPGRRFVYGKENRMLGIAPFMELSKVLISPGQGQLFDLNIFGQIGPILALHRPYYVDVFQATSGGGPGQPIAGISVPTPFSSEITYSDIIGRSKNLEFGWDQMTIKPGASARLGTRIGLARRSEFLTELVFSVQADYFFQSQTLMITDLDQQLFMNVSAGLVIGSRW